MYEVNRSVIIVVPQEPFWQWLTQLPDSDLGGLTLAELQEDANSYLLPACQNTDEMWDEIEPRIYEIFTAELADWCEDENLWPDVNIAVFENWFDVNLSSIIMDLSHEPLERDVFEPI